MLCLRTIKQGISVTLGLTAETVKMILNYSCILLRQFLNFQNILKGILETGNCPRLEQRLVIEPIVVFATLFPRLVTTFYAPVTVTYFPALAIVCLFTRYFCCRQLKSIHYYAFSTMPKVTCFPTLFNVYVFQCLEF